MFGDQHVESLGGAQVSMRLQRRYLERAGHTVSIVAPAMHGHARRRVAVGDAAYLDIPSVPITVDLEYSMALPGRRTDRWVDEALAGRPPVDVVHVQSDFWGALIGHRFAARHLLPVVHTMHNRVDVGVHQTVPFPKLALRGMNAWQRRGLGGASARQLGRDGWAFLRRYASRSDAVTAPSAHFARRLERHGVVPRSGRVEVIWNGIDDEVLDQVIAAEPDARTPGPPRFVWIGRMSPEKRLLPFLEAVAESGVRAEVEVIGGGTQRAAAQRLVERRDPVADVRFSGRLPYGQTLTRIAAADAVVQTSIGFETQGMTIFEAASLGTPSVVSDPDLARELGRGFWAVGGGADDAPEVADASVGALAAALREAARDIEAGSAVSVEPTIRERFHQSSRTAAMIEIYERALGSADRA